MMLRLLRKRILSPTSCESLISRSLFSSSSQIHNPQPHFMVRYLINSCGLPPEKAAVASKKLTHLKSPEGPHSVLAFLKQWGFDDTYIRRMVTTFPNLLGYSVDKPLDTNIKSLLETGFSRDDLPKVLLFNPQLLVNANIRPRIEFWRTFLGNDDSKLRRTLQRSRSLFGSDIARNVTPKITLLKNHGLSDQQIQKLVILGCSIFTSSINKIQSLLKWTEDLRLVVDSPLFVYHLNALNRSSRPQYEAKMEFLKTNYGWSEHDFLGTFRKYPVFITLSLKNIQAKMEFLVDSVACKPAYIARHPRLFSYSLEKRMMPRNHVFRILEAEELQSMDFHSMMYLTDKMFLERCVREFEDKVPQLLDIYENACAGRFLLHPSRVLA